MHYWHYSTINIRIISYLENTIARLFGQLTLYNALVKHFILLPRGESFLWMKFSLRDGKLMQLFFANFLTFAESAYMILESMRLQQSMWVLF